MGVIGPETCAKWNNYKYLNNPSEQDTMRYQFIIFQLNLIFI